MVLTDGNVWNLSEHNLVPRYYDKLIYTEPGYKHPQLPSLSSVLLLTRFRLITSVSLTPACTYIRFLIIDTMLPVIVILLGNTILYFDRNRSQS